MDSKFPPVLYAVSADACKKSLVSDVSSPILVASAYILIIASLDCISFIPVPPETLPSNCGAFVKSRFLCICAAIPAPAVAVLVVPPAADIPCMDCVIVSMSYPALPAFLNMDSSPLNNSSSDNPNCLWTPLNLPDSCSKN